MEQCAHTVSSEIFTPVGRNLQDRGRMKLLYLNVLLLGTEDHQETIIDWFNEQMKIADSVENPVGYTSNASLAELDRLMNECNIAKVCLNMGMYFIEGMSETAYHTALKIHEK